MSLRRDLFKAEVAVRLIEIADEAFRGLPPRRQATWPAVEHIAANIKPRSANGGMETDILQRNQDVLAARGPIRLDRSLQRRSAVLRAIVRLSTHRSRQGLCVV